MQAKLSRMNRWLLPVVMGLFVLEILLLPLVVAYTYAGRSDSPDQVLTYTENRLTWDSGTHIRPDGTAEMELFFPDYDGTVLSANGDDVVAPGTGEDNIVRLQNAVPGDIRYTAVLYEIKSDPDLPVQAQLTVQGAEDTASYPLPEGVSPSKVLRAVTGILPGKQLQDFDVDWAWDFHVDEEQDRVDTAFGNGDPLEDITVGLYIVVEDDNSYIVPEVPKTGDESPVAMYLTLMGISLFVLILLLLERRREKQADA